MCICPYASFAGLCTPQRGSTHRLSWSDTTSLPSADQWLDVQVSAGWSWIWIVVAVGGQATCIAAIIQYARSHLGSRYPYLRGPAHQAAMDRMLFGIGTALTVFGAIMFGAVLEAALLGRVVIVLVCWVPALVANITANAVAARRSHGVSAEEIDS